MDATKQVAKFSEFFETLFYKDLLDTVAKGNKFLSIPFSDLAKFHVELAEDLLEDPENTLQAAKHTIEQMDLGTDIKGFEIRFSDLPKTSYLRIRNIRSKHINTFLQVEGIVRQKSDVRPQVTSARFECPSCGNIIPVLQLDQKFKEPHFCACGRKGQFRLLHKELVDAQKIVLEEAPEDMDGGEQPKRLNIFLKNDLVSPISDKKTNPGSKVRLTGIVKEVPIVLATGGKSTRFDLICEANYVEPVQEEFTNIVFTEEEIEEIKKIPHQSDYFELLTKSLAPSIYGHDKVKEALLLQLLGGVQKKSNDGVKRRGDIHVLLIGDPGSGKCSRGDTKIMLSSGEIVTLEELAKINNLSDEEKLVDNLQLPSLGLNGGMYSGNAVRVWQRNSEHLLKISLRSGKKLFVTKNHPLFFHQNGHITAKEATDFKVGTHIATPRKILIKGSLQTFNENLIKPKANGKIYSFPQILNESFARLLGYWCGDGYLAKSNTSAWISLTNNNEDILKDYSLQFKCLFNQFPTRRVSHKGKSANELYTTSRPLFNKLNQYFPEICKKSNKKSIPRLILKSPNNILKNFIKALFDCDAHVNVKKRQIEYCTISKELAEQVQLSLLRFGIVAFLKEKLKFATNTKEKNKVKAYELIISGSFFELYKINIGFVSLNKSSALNITRLFNTNVDVVPNTANLLFYIRKSLCLKQSEMGVSRPTYAHYEQKNRLPSIRTLRKISDYLTKLDPDNESVLLLSQLAYADVFWDEIMTIEEIIHNNTVFDLEVEKTHNYVANGVIIHNSQLAKRMSIVAPKSRFVSGKGASLEYDEPILIRENKQIKLVKIGDLVENNCVDKNDIFLPFKKNIESLSFNPKNFNLEWKKIDFGYKHKSKESLLKLTLETGREITITKDHSVFGVENSALCCKEAKYFKKGNTITIPKIIPNNNKLIKNELFIANLLGYYVAEGHLNAKEGSYYKIEFTLHKKEQYIVDELREDSLKLFNKDLAVYKHGTNAIRVVIHGKEAYFNMKEYLGSCFGKKAKTKVVPEIIFSMSKEGKEEFIRTYIASDAGVTKSKDLMSSMQYLFLQCGIISSYVVRDDTKNTIIGKRVIHATGNRYDLKAPHIKKIYNAQYEAIPLEAIDPEIRTRYCKSIISSKYTRLTWNRLSYLPLIERLLYLGDNKESLGTDLVKKFGRKVNEYLSDNLDLFIKIKYGRTHKVVLTSKGNKLYQKLVSLKQLCESDFGFCRIKKVEEIKPKNNIVYDVSVLGFENFVGGFGGIICHNSGAGLTASVVKDEFLRGWALEAGTLVLANKGIAVIDELDKMSEDDTSAMHEALEQQTVSISKANIQATLRCETTVLAAANPKFGRFDPYELIAKQINLPEPLINRFDLIFPIKDIPNPERDNKMAAFILNLHRGSKEEKDDSLLETKFLRKYIAYAKQYVKPELTDDALDEIKKYYVQMRNQGGEGATSAVPISARQLEALVRLSEASAKLRLNSHVTKQDAQRAIDLMHYCLSQIGIDPETGKFDIDRITTGITAKQRSNISLVKEVINELEKAIGKIIPEDDVIREAEIKGVSEEKTSEILTKLNRQGDLFSPKNGFISKVR